MVNLKIDWKVPKAACLVKLKRGKDESVDLSPPAPRPSAVLMFHEYKSERNKFRPTPCDGRGGGGGGCGGGGEVRILNISPSAFISQVPTKSLWITPAGCWWQYREKP